MPKHKAAPAAEPVANDMHDREVTEALEALSSAQRAVADLAAKYAATERGMADLVADRGAVAFDAHGAGIEEAAQRLEEINHQVAVYASHTASLAEALAEARRRVVAAEAAHQRAIDRRQARDVLVRLEACRAAAAGLDEMLERTFGALRSTLDEFQALGHATDGFPSVEQIRVFTDFAIRTAAFDHRHLFGVAAIEPANRRSFSDNWKSWSALVDRWCASKLADSPGAA